MFCALCVAAIFLVEKYISKRKDLQVAYQLLHKDSDVIGPLLHDVQVNWVYCSSRACIKENEADLVLSHATEFATAVDALSMFISTDNTTNYQTYFSRTIEIDTKAQHTLRQAQKNFTETLQRYLDTEDAKQHEMYLTARKQGEIQLRKMQHAIDQLPMGKALTFHSSLKIEDRTFTIPVNVHKVPTGIRFDEGRNLIEQYLKRLDYEIESPEKQEIRNLLDDLKDVVPKPGIVRVYGIEYNLSAVSPAELNSIYKYLLLTQKKISDSFSRTTADPMSRL